MGVCVVLDASSPGFQEQEDEREDGETTEEAKDGREGSERHGFFKRLLDSIRRLRHPNVALFPVLSSVSLLTMYFFFSYIQSLLLLLVVVSCSYALFFSLAPLVDMLFFFSCSPSSRRGDTGGNTTRSNNTARVTATGMVVAMIVVGWLLSGSWILNNILASCMCVAFLSHVRMPNVRACAVLMAGLVVYDVFWVFLSEGVFGSNVMTETAQKKADNPFYRLEEVIVGNNESTMYAAKTLELPMKLIFPQDLSLGDVSSTAGHSMLGCGDIVIPGLLMILAMQMDVENKAIEPMLTALKRTRMVSGRSHLLPMWRCNRGNSRGDDTGGGHGNTTTPSSRYCFPMKTAPSASSILGWLRCGMKRCSQSYVLSFLFAYSMGLQLALGCSAFFSSAQPALFYLAPCTLCAIGSVAVGRGEWSKLWESPLTSTLPVSEDDAS